VSEDRSTGKAAEAESEEVSGTGRGRTRGGAVVSVYEDGPLIVRGQFTICDQGGQLIPAGRRTVALCRCGRSAIKPFCDGSHARTGFRAPGGAERGRAGQGEPAAN
jgi:CDGSH-type Zn-finger protein